MWNAKACAPLLALVLGLALGLSPTPARADAVDDSAQDVVDALRKGDVDAAVAVLEDTQFVAELSSRPALVHVLCDRAYRFDAACRAASAPSRMMLATVLHEVAEDAYLSSPGDARASWALAHAVVLRERSGMAAGASAWLRAAELLEQAHTATPGDGEALGYAVTFLLEGGGVETDRRRDLLTRADGVAKTIRGAYPHNSTLATTVAGAYLWAAESYLGSDRRAAKAAVLEAITSLRPLVDTPFPEISVATLWNEAVDLDARLRLSLREKPLTKTAYALRGALRFEVPVSSRWTVTEVPETENADSYVYVTQAAADGTVLRQILFRSYEWGLAYTFDGPNDVNGDNVKSVARGLQAISAERVFAPGADVGTPRKGKFGDGLSGWLFDVRGTTRDEKPRALHLLGHCGRTKHQATHAVLVYVYGGDGELDAAAERVIASMGEPDS